jgi:hypothetical protein
MPTPLGTKSSAISITIQKMARIRLRSLKLLLLLSLLGVQAFAPVRNSPKLGRQTYSQQQQQQQLQHQCPVRQRGTELYFLGTDGGILGVGAPEVVSSNVVVSDGVFARLDLVRIEIG